MSAGRVPGVSRVSARTIQIGLGIIWLLDGLLQLQPDMFGPAFANQVILPSAQGQPGFLSSFITHMAHLIAAQPALTNSVFAGIQILIGVGLLVRETVKPALVLSFVWALGVWALGEGFGMLFTGMASPLTGAPGGALLYAAIGVLVWPRATGPVAKVRPPPRARWANGAARPSGPSCGAAWGSCGSSRPTGPAAASRARSAAPSAASPAGWRTCSCRWRTPWGTAAVQWPSAAQRLSFVIGFGPLVSRHTTVFLVAGAALALDYWMFGEAFGQLFTGVATDPNTGPLLVLLGLTLYPNRVPVRSAADAGPLGVEAAARGPAFSLSG